MLLVEGLPGNGFDAGHLRQMHLRSSEARFDVLPTNMRPATSGLVLLSYKLSQVDSVVAAPCKYTLVNFYKYSGTQLFSLLSWTLKISSSAVLVFDSAQ